MLFLAISILGAVLPVGFGETTATMSIQKNNALDTTAITVIESNANTVAGTVHEQVERLKDLSHASGFRAGVVFQSRDNEHVILYTQWESAEASSQAAGRTSGASGLRPFGVAYLAMRDGGDRLVLGKGGTPAILINVISTEPGRIDKLFEFWVRGAENYWLKLPDVIGAALHRSADNRTLINIAAWTSGEAWRNAADHAGDSRAGSHGVGTSDPKLYDVVEIRTR
jgi:hypothetical protein